VKEQRNSFPASIGKQEDIFEGPLGQKAHKKTIEHTKRLERKLYEVRPGVWSQVGNGLSNQNFIEGPEGLIVIDTGESREEMTASLKEVREHTDAPVAAVIYTHFHYVHGTSALWEEVSEQPPIWGHSEIENNLRRIGIDVSAAATRGLVHQFGLMLPTEGQDGIVNSALGQYFRLEEHSPWTPGYIAPTHTFNEPTRAMIAGLEVEMTPAPSDANDSITIWFPEIKVCVNNLLWPTLFNVFAIRGEEYRDPRILIEGIEHMITLEAEHLIGAHGPPLSGTQQILDDLTQYRDSIQFMWDQTVRGINKGLTLSEITELVQLPQKYENRYFTQQFYGLVEHHVRQIHNGLRGWFDGNESALFPLPASKRAEKLVDGFGGKEKVREEITKALEEDDLRWALELATWLIQQEINKNGRSNGGEIEDRNRLASILRKIGQRTTSTNVRNWCLTRALELEGELDIDRFRTHRFSERQVLNQPTKAFVHALRLLLEPELSSELDIRIGWRFDDESTAGLHLRNGVAVPTDGEGSEATLVIKINDWARMLGGKTTLKELLEHQNAEIEGNYKAFIEAISCFDNPSLR
jgi:alkyl sulfatase BDS1-like metallo-beta-lactamase superfamily hydrolase